MLDTVIFDSRRNANVEENVWHNSLLIFKKLYIIDVPILSTYYFSLFPFQ